MRKTAQPSGGAITPRPRSQRQDRRLFEALQQARSRSGLSQDELAKRIGMRQRQISDLERAAMDPRLSTIENVARALDLELVLIPRQLIAVVEGLQRGAASADEPLYALPDEDAEPDLDRTSKEPR